MSAQALNIDAYPLSLWNFKGPAFRRRGGNQIAFFILIEDKVEEKGGRTQTRKEKPLVTF